MAPAHLRRARRRQPRQAGRDIAADRDIGRAQLADLAAVAIQMHDPRVRRELGQLAGRAVVEARADDQQQIRFLHRQVRRARAVHAQHAQVRRMRRRQGTETAQGQHGRDPGQVGEFAKRLQRLAQDDAAAAVDHRALGLGDHRRGLVDRMVGAARHGVGLRRHVRAQMRGIADLHVLRQVDQHRPGPAGSRDTEGFGDDVRQLVDAAQQEAVLDDRQGHAEHVQLLERIRAQQRRRHLAGDDDHRHRVQHRIGDAGDQVRRAGTGRRNAHSDAPAGPRKPVRGEGRALLVADEYVLQRRAVQRVVERHDRAARIPEDRLDAFGFQGLHQPARAVHQAASFRASGLAAPAAASPLSQTILARSSRPTFSIG